MLKLGVVCKYKDIMIMLINISIPNLIASQQRSRSPLSICMLQELCGIELYLHNYLRVHYHRSDFHQIQFELHPTIDPVLHFSMRTRGAV